MSKTFLSNTIWYLLLMLVSLAVLSAALIKARDRRFAFAFWLAVLGFFYCIEIILLEVLKAYTYYPGLVEDHFQDSVLGNFFSQISVSSTALLFCVLDLAGWWIFIFSAAYFAIDALFVSLGIYAHNWYCSFYTLAGFIPLFWFAGKWYRGFLLYPEKRVFYPSLFLGVFAAAGNTAITPLKLTGIQVFAAGLAGEASEDHLITALIYGPALALVMIRLIASKERVSRKLFFLSLLFAFQLLLCGLGLIRVKPGWLIPAALIDISSYFLWAAVLSRWLKPRALMPSGRRIKILA